MGNSLGRHCKTSAIDEDVDAHLAIFQPPAFNRHQPVQWFGDIEQHFEAFEINSDAAKCELIINVLDIEVLHLIKIDEICDGDCEGERYECIKSAVLQWCHLVDRQC